MRLALVIGVDGVIRLEELDLTLDSLQRLVGGNVEHIENDHLDPELPDVDWHGWVNEDGSGLPRNEVATAFAGSIGWSGAAFGDCLSGTLVLTGAYEDESGESGNVPFALVQFAELLGAMGLVELGLAEPVSQ